MSKGRLPFIPLCRRCEKEMVEGFIPDFCHGNSRQQPFWVPGKPVTSYWMGLKLPASQYPVAAFRCPECGSLELFAR
jgi:hypothetical protein